MIWYERIRLLRFFACFCVAFTGGALFSACSTVEENTAIIYVGGMEEAARVALKSVVMVVTTFTYFDEIDGENDIDFYSSGVIYKIVADDVYIFTNYHVVRDELSLTENHYAKSIVMYIYNHEETDAISTDVVGVWPENDIAILRASVNDFVEEPVEVKIGDLNKVEVGSAVIAVGDPLGYGLSVTAGIISKINDTVENGMLRIDAPINSGNSGGGIFNNRGELLGIVSQKYVDNDVTIEGMGFAVPVHTAISIADEIIANDRIGMYL
jgi:serine protease Do